MEVRRNRNERDALEMQEKANAGTPIYDAQVQAKLEQTWARRRDAEAGLQSELRQFMTVSGRCVGRCEYVGFRR